MITCPGRKLKALAFCCDGNFRTVRRSPEIRNSCIGPAARGKRPSGSCLPSTPAEARRRICRIFRRNCGAWRIRSENNINSRSSNVTSKSIPSGNFPMTILFRKRGLRFQGFGGTSFLEPFKYVEKETDGIADRVHLSDRWVRRSAEKSAGLPGDLVSDRTGQKTI